MWSSPLIVARSFLLRTTGALSSSSWRWSTNRANPLLSTLTPTSCSTWTPGTIWSPLATNYNHIYFYVIKMYIQYTFIQWTSFQQVYLPGLSVVVVGVLLLTGFLLSGRFAPNSGESRSSMIWNSWLIRYMAFAGFLNFCVHKNFVIFLYEYLNFL